MLSRLLWLVFTVFGQSDYTDVFHLCHQQPCRNGCKCFPAALNPDDYVCLVQQGGVPHVGKNCEFTLVASCNKFEIKLRIPEQANIRDIATTGGAVVNTEVGDGEVIVKTTCENSFLHNGKFMCSNTFVAHDGVVDDISPIVNVRCAMETYSTQNLVQATIRRSTAIDVFHVWNPIMNFYLSPFGSAKPVLCPAVEIDEGYTYVVGERIHVVVTGNLNGNRPNEDYLIQIQHCHIKNNIDGSSIQVITYGEAVNSKTGVGIERNPGFIGEGAHPEGAAFWFQVFKFKTEDHLNLVCEVSFDKRTTDGGGIIKRSAATILEDVSIPFIIIGELSESNDDVIPIITINEAVTNHISRTECEGILCAAIISRHYSYVGYALLVLVLMSLAVTMLILNRRVLTAFCGGKSQIA